MSHLSSMSSSGTVRLSDTLPPLIFGTATFNFQFNPDPYALPTTHLVHRALALGVRAFDTSPYYGPAEELLGAALDTEHVRSNYPRNSYHLLTKVGRIAADEFDYSPGWVRYSVKRSLARLCTEYLDVVYCHDVEFVSSSEVLEAVRELRRIRDEDGTIKFVGISAYPLMALRNMAEIVYRETGESLDAAMSYGHYTLQNTKLLTKGVPQLLARGIEVVPNASPLGMGLLRQQGVPVGAMGNWHPAPDGLRKAVRRASNWTDKHAKKLETIAVYYALEDWLRNGGDVGTRGDPIPPHADRARSARPSSGKLGISVIGVSRLQELEETMRIWHSVIDGLGDDPQMQTDLRTSSDGSQGDDWNFQRRQHIRKLAEGVREAIGQYKDYSWESPPKNFVNRRELKNAEKLGNGALENSSS